MLTAFLIWRTRLYPGWPAAPLLAGWLLFVPSREAGVGALAIGTDVLVILGLVPLAWAMLTRPAPQVLVATSTDHVDWHA